MRTMAREGEGVECCLLIANQLQRSSYTQSYGWPLLTLAMFIILSLQLCRKNNKIASLQCWERERERENPASKCNQAHHLWIVLKPANNRRPMESSECVTHLCLPLQSTFHLVKLSFLSLSLSLVFVMVVGLFLKQFEHKCYEINCQQHTHTNQARPAHLDTHSGFIFTFCLAGVN